MTVSAAQMVACLVWAVLCEHPHPGFPTLTTYPQPTDLHSILVFLVVLFLGAVLPLGHTCRRHWETVPRISQIPKIGAVLFSPPCRVARRDEV
ncbi:hypothetical protein QBC34DRAFT_411317 [Podospora aff. communis PSN243]|uniref:Uncharacterized protein n=1 Tax=Podospora aff. communis PSN243 TaxID=3040156 RepID=A0AAV9GGI1_9PEZI|nr:hypothetical protein QBC34DRAFT_411317 [Podospora aff. communis PSN243]